MTSTRPFATLLVLCLVAVPTASALALSPWLRDPPPIYAATGLGAGASGSSTYACRDHATLVTAELVDLGANANATHAYRLTFAASSPCAPMADDCRGVAEEDAIRGTCSLGATFTLRSLRVTPIAQGSHADADLASWSLHVRDVEQIGNDRITRVVQADMTGVRLDVARP